MLRRLLVTLALAAAVAGCGGGGGGDGEGTAELWVTRDRGAEVVLTATVPSGLTVLQALDREADVETRFGGRFVQAINGIEGSLAQQRDWFYFLNGIEPDLGAAEVRLRPGDVAWWDFRSWQGSMEQPVVVGAFPEPLVNGFDGRRRLELRSPPELQEAADALAASIGATSGEGEPNVFVLEVDPAADGATLTAARGPANDSPVTLTLGGSAAAVRAAALALAADPTIVRFRYDVRFDEQGDVVE
jgi:hypothetical protein